MKINFDTDWTFIDSKGNTHSVCLPHDAMLTETRDPSCHNGAQSGYYPGGKYTYKKSFTLSDEQIGKPLALLFEGAYQNARVLMNGKEIARHHYGYTEFTADMTKAARLGSNELTVTLDNSLEPNCRWYSGSGLYRSVWLLIDELDDPVITTKSIRPAVIHVEAATGTQITILDGDTIVAQGEPGDFMIPDAKLWSDTTPHLYTCRIENEERSKELSFGIRKLSWSAKTGLCVNGRRTLLRGGCIHHDNGVLGACGFAEAEERRVRILKEAGYNAIRSAHNPMSRAMLDACDRLGMYVMDEAFDGWYTPKNYHDYSRFFEKEWQSDIRAMVEKDINHPCVILYSVGNEVSETASDKGVETCALLTAYVHQLDATRPVTCGVNVLLNVYTNMGFGVYKDSGNYEAKPLPPKEKGYKEKKTGSTFFNAMAQRLGGLMFFMSKGKKGDVASKGAAGALDIIGLNYAASRYDEDVKNYPDRMMVGSETMVTDLPYNWKRVERHPAIIGDFVWAAWDYLGEAGVGDWIYHSYKGLPLLAGSGTIDITGKITAEAYYQQIIWGLRQEPWLGVRPLNHADELPTKSAWRFTNAIDSWTWQGYEGTKAVAEVFARGHRVRLEFNGEVVAERRLKDYKAKFDVPYQPGTLTAVALDKSGNELSRTSLVSGGEDEILTLKPDKTVLHPGELCFIPIEITDGKGVLKPYVEIPVHVQVEGAASLQGLGSALSKTDESYLADTFTSYRGRLLAVIRAGNTPGKAVVKVRTGLTAPSELVIEVLE